MKKQEKVAIVEKVENAERPRAEEQKKLLTTRINRLVGQLGGIKKMVENDRSCNELLIQISSVSSGLKGLANDVIGDYMRDTFLEKMKNGDENAVEEIVEFFKRFQ